MSFASKEIRGLFKIILFGIVGLVLVYLFLQLLPLILLVGAASWLGYKIIKAVRARASKKNAFINNVNNEDYSSVERKEAYPNAQIIDVDYEEVK
ncbi:MAG TPA: hypothetical protein VIK72_08390 [Clostridiaceae bacterium]